MDSQDLGINQQSPILIKNKDGWYVPANDVMGYEYISAEVQDLPMLLNQCTRFGTCVQAGGNIGIWPVALAKKFNTVHTVEPDYVNYEALALNCADYPNILHQRAGFGDSKKTGSIRVGIEGNMGALQTTEGTDFEIITIDSLKLSECDLIQLDIEGYEYFALLGAEKTIMQYRPVICIEMNGLSFKYGKSDTDTVNLLSHMGYTQVAVMRKDYIFKPN